MAIKSLIQTITVGAAGATSLIFSNIKQESGSDLLLVLSLRGSFGAPNYNGQINFNNDTAGNYSSRFLSGDGSNISTLTVVGNASALRPFIVGSTATANTFSNSSVFIPNYSSTVAKSISIDNTTENGLAAGNESIFAGTYSGTAGIATLTVSNGFTLVQYSTASLYKIAYA